VWAKARGWGTRGAAAPPQRLIISFGGAPSYQTARTERAPPRCCKRARGSVPKRGLRSILVMVTGAFFHRRAARSGNLSLRATAAARLTDERRRVVCLREAFVARVRSNVGGCHSASAFSCGVGVARPHIARREEKAKLFFFDFSFSLWSLESSCVLWLTRPTRPSRPRTRARRVLRRNLRPLPAPPAASGRAACPAAQLRASSPTF
jgi:hypothetical protein